MNKKYGYVAYLHRFLKPVSLYEETADIPLPTLDKFLRSQLH